MAFLVNNLKNSIIIVGDYTMKLKPFLISAFFLLLMWGSFLLGLDNHEVYVRLGIYPRRAQSLVSIFTGPFIHGDWEHLIFNSSSFLVLTTMLFYFYKNIADKVFAIGFLLTGLMIWFFARPSYHIGMSGVIYAEFGFLFLAGFLSRNRPQIVASFITVLFYGSMVWGVFPGKPGVSWEAHLFGFMVGVFCILLFRKELFTAFYTFDKEADIDEYMQFDISQKQKRVE